MLQYYIRLYVCIYIYIYIYTHVNIACIDINMYNSFLCGLFVLLCCVCLFCVCWFCCLGCSYPLGAGLGGAAHLEGGQPALHALEQHVQQEALAGAVEASEVRKLFLLLSMLYVLCV